MSIRAIGLVLALQPAPACADEVFAGIYAHQVDTPFSMDTQESGADLEVGYRLEPIKSLDIIGSPAPYFIVSMNSVGDTSFAGAGLGWKLRLGRLYVRPEFGLVVHDGPSRKATSSGNQMQLGSRILFEPSLAIGAQLDDRLSIEASWVHISHGGLCNKEQNPGLDMWGARVNLRL